MRTLGIIGQGNFGKFTAQEMDGLFEIETYDVGNTDDQFDKVAACDYIVLAIPLANYAEVLPRLAGTIAPSTIIVDVCSVKLRSLELIARHLPNHDVLSIHPLFGPSTSPDGIEGQKLVIIRDIGSFELHAKAQSFFEKLKLVVIQMDADKHDRAMAELHALTYFVAAALSDFGVSERPISMPSYDKLVELVNLYGTHSQGLIETVEEGNPYAAEMRTKLIQSFEKINRNFSDKVE